MSLVSFRKSGLLRFGLLLSMTASFLSGGSAAYAAPPDNTQPSASSAMYKGSEKFALLAETFMKDSLAMSPAAASQAGYHKHKDARTGKVIELDALLDDLSEKGIAEQRSFCRNWREKFHTDTPVASLNSEDAADWHLIDDEISLRLLEYDKIQQYKHNPSVGVELIGNALFQPLTEDYAPLETRLAHILGRVGQIPRFLADQKSTISDTNSIYLSTAKEENEGNIELIQQTIAAQIPAGSALKAEYDRVAPPALAALKDYSRWLMEVQAKCPDTYSWRLGKPLYDQKFKLVMEVDITPEQLLSDAEHDLKTVRAEMLKVALPLYRQMFPGEGEHAELDAHAQENLIISKVLQKISDQHPDRKDLQKAIEADIDGIKQFIREKKIVALSSRDNLRVVATPMFERGVLSVAAFHSAPPLNPKAEAQYWVTPIESTVPDDQAESKLREYNNFTLKWLTIHEALPGHYIQAEHLNNLHPEWRRLLRALYGNGAYIEGWAEYIAQVMMDEGFMSNDPRFRMIMRKIRLRVLSNAILDIKMHTMNMSDADAMKFMTEEAFQTKAEAEGKLRRAKLSSTQLPTYYVGIREWFAFRERYQKAAGDKFNLMEFHDRALDEGPLPVPLVEKLMMRGLH